MTDLVSALAAHRLFASLSREELGALARRFARRDFATDEVIFREGDPGDELTIVTDGSVRTSKRGTDGRDVTLGRLGPSDVAGLTSLATGKAHSATLTARAPTIVHVLPRADFDALLSEHPSVERALLGHLAEKVRKRNAELVRERTASEDSRLRVAFFDAKDYARASFLEEAPDLDFHFFDVRLELETVPLVERAPVVCAFVNDRLDAAVLSELAARGVELVALRCAGYNHVDVEAAERLELSVVRVPAYSPHAVAEHCVALILCLDRKIHIAHARVRDGNFSLSGLVGFDMHGRTAGVAGVGAIGKCLVRILRGFGMRVLGWDVAPDPSFAAESGLEYVDFDTLLARSDVLCLNVPLAPSTRHLIGANELARMKKGSMLVNTSRGGLVDARALVEALKSGHLGSAGLDVYEEESAYFFEDHSSGVITDDTLARLLTFPNVLVTSHQGFLTEDALVAIARTTAANIREWKSGVRGRALTHAVVPARPAP